MNPFFNQFSAKLRSILTASFVGLVSFGMSATGFALADEGLTVRPVAMNAVGLEGTVRRD